MYTITRMATAGAVFCMLTSFGKSTPHFIGTFGVHGSDPARISLTLNDDHTFTYHDHSNPQKKIDASGNWVLKGEKVILKNYSSPYTFHVKWKFAKNGQVARSRRNLSYYTIGKL